MSPKVVPFKSLGVVSYSTSVVTMSVSVAVCDIFSVKEWPHLETGLGFVKMFDARKTGMIGLPYGGKTMTIC